jgi:hypothetical protein
MHAAPIVVCDEDVPTLMPLTADEREADHIEASKFDRKASEALWTPRKSSTEAAATPPNLWEQSRMSPSEIRRDPGVF